MYKIIFLLLSIVVFNKNGFNQIQKIKIKTNKTVHYYYEKDSSCIETDNVMKMATLLQDFFVSIETNDYETYLSQLSKTTLEKIDSTKLINKYRKFRIYNIALSGRIKIKSITKYNKRTFEQSQIYICVFKLPKGQTIEKRVGFDPLKRMNFEDVSSYAGLHFVSEDNGYKVVIPW